MDDLKKRAFLDRPAFPLEGPLPSTEQLWLIEGWRQCIQWIEATANAARAQSEGITMEDRNGNDE